MSTIFTIGHSTRTLDNFIELLRENAIQRVVDIRTIPRSRYNPQFNRETLPASLAAAGIAYTHMAGLGGLRRPRSDSPNTAWRNTSFRGFADYMLTEAFRVSLQELTDLAQREVVSLMCAEAVPWRCHRSLISDALSVRGWTVKEIIDRHEVRDHALTPFARVEGEQVTYPAMI